MPFRIAKNDCIVMPEVDSTEFLRCSDNTLQFDVSNSLFVCSSFICQINARLRCVYVFVCLVFLRAFVNCAMAKLMNFIWNKINAESMYLLGIRAHHNHNICFNSLQKTNNNIKKLNYACLMPKVSASAGSGLISYKLVAWTW